MHADLCGTGSSGGSDPLPDDGDDTSDPEGTSGTSSPAEPEPGDTVPCDTGDPVVDDPDVQEGMQSLWAASNYGPDVNLAKRSEHGGWIVQTVSGYQVVPWTQLETSWCGAEGYEPFTTSGTVVGFVHTHPYAVGETIVSCDWSIETYRGDPSDVDRTLSVTLGQQLGITPALPGWIIDADGITRFSGEEESGDQRHARCGY